MNYALVTPARNEGQYIDLTLKSMISQSRPPLRWVIVSDGSTDNTDEIVQKYMSDHSWIKLLRMPERKERYFAGKVMAFRAGYEELAGLEFEVVGNLDADISFGPDHFEFLIERFTENPRLGCAGTAFSEKGLSYNYDFVGTEHVSGMCQMFRRECFEEFGGYQPIKSGGIDLVAVLSARAKGWETRTFPGMLFEHHRIQGGALHAGLRERVYTGRKDYLLGNHPLWEIFRSLYQMRRRPYLVGGMVVLGSYLWNAMRGVEKTIPKELMILRRNDQMKRLKGLLQRRISERHSARVSGTSKAS